jgi:GntR family transcriptional regulator, transcriptional repressor for pyruvate dehydrogenase complex
MAGEVLNESRLTTGLSRDTLSDQVAKHLLHYIINKDLKPGELLPSMGVLTREFEVSLPVIREALKSLSALGVITIIKGKGALVKPIDDELLRVFFSRAIRLETEPLTQLIEVRLPLEVQSASLAAQRHTPADIQHLEQIVSDMRLNLTNADRYINLDAQYHLAIALATHNLMLYYLLSSIRGALEDSMAMIRKKREEQGMLGNEQTAHELIGAEIKQGHAARAGAAMAEHLSETVSLIKKIESKPLVS